MDLRSFLDSLGNDLLEIDEPVSVVHEMTALQHELDRAGRFPVLRFLRPRLPGGEPSVITDTDGNRIEVRAASA